MLMLFHGHGPTLINITATNTDNVVDTNDVNDANAAYTPVADNAAAGTVGTIHQYTHSEVMGMDALQQQTGWWFEGRCIEPT